MIERLDVYSPEVRDDAKRIVIRLSKQGKEEIAYVLKVIFPEAKALGLASVAELLAHGNNPIGEFLNLVEAEKVDVESWKVLAGSNQDSQILSVRSSFAPTKFELSITCARTPLKEFFEECQNKTCDSCIQGRLEAIAFSTKNPWEIKLNRTEQRRVDLCKNCGNLLSNKDEIQMRNERLMYRCHYCGHKGWNQAK